MKKILSCSSVPHIFSTTVFCFFLCLFFPACHKNAGASALQEQVSTVKENYSDTKKENSYPEEKLTEQAADASKSANSPKIDTVWQNLYAKLQKDGFAEKDLLAFFLPLENGFSQKPMGNKVKELYNANIAPKKKKSKPKDQQTKPKKEDPLQKLTGIPYPWYDGYVTEEIAGKCVQFIRDNKEYLDNAEKQYQVPKEILSSLIYVETWHGKFLGKFTPLSMLASMAISTDLAMLPNYTKNLTMNDTQKIWLQEKIQKRADWAYNELKALLTYSLNNGIDIMTIPSSIYGAIGYGQFMPSNISVFGVDGNKDGKIDLFNTADAIPSIANFLHRQGWTKMDLPFKKQVKVLKRYNYSTSYAHTILALAKLTSIMEKKEQEKSKASAKEQATSESPADQSSTDQRTNQGTAGNEK